MPNPPTCVEWPGPVANPYTYVSANCGEITVTTPVEDGWSCDRWKREHNENIDVAKVECPEA